MENKGRGGARVVGTGSGAVSQNKVLVEEVMTDNKPVGNPCKKLDLSHFYIAINVKSIPGSLQYLGLCTQYSFGLPKPLLHSINI